MPEPTTFAELVDGILALVNIFIPAILAILFFIVAWKLIDAWVLNGADAAKQQEGRQTLIVGVVVFVLIVTFWGLVSLLRTTFFRLILTKPLFCARI